MYSSEDSQRHASALGGKWLGSIRNSGKESEIQINFVNSRIISASINLPGHDSKFIPLTNAQFKPPQVHFEYITPDSRGVFDGTLNNNKITGSFSKDGESGSFELTKAPEEVSN